MARSNILTFPSCGHLKRTFEELPLFSERAANGDVLFAGLVDGEVEISYGLDGDWWVSDISISIENGRMGSAGRSKMVNLSSEEQPLLYSLILDVFSDKYHETISEWVHEQLAEAA